MKNLKHVLSANDHLVTGRKFDILKNLHTRILETHPRPSNEELPLYYDSVNYTSHNDKSAGIVSFCYRIVKSISTRRKMRICQKSISKKTSQNKPRLLDVGCGTADFLYSCLKKGWQINGIENNTNAKNNLHTEVSSFIFDDFEFLKSQPERFDIITMWHSLEHVTDLRQTILDMKKLLTSNGVIVVACPNHKSFDAVFYKESWAAYDLPRHLWHFNKDSISMLFLQENMRLTKTYPMYWDSFYISILSEKIISKKNKFLKGIFIGLLSNVSALFSKEYSSLIYVFNKEN
jgi:2-polyprenyl-3-methyl-5-hydroxy-6-metoxy-1,4-benzoquinol methylase